MRNAFEMEEGERLSAQDILSDLAEELMKGDEVRVWNPILGMSEPRDKVWACVKGLPEEERRSIWYVLALVKKQARPIFLREICEINNPNVRDFIVSLQEAIANNLCIVCDLPLSHEERVSCDGGNYRHPDCCVASD